MKKIISAILICLFLSSSAHSETQMLKDFKEKIPRVAGFYTGAARFYYHAITTSDNNKLRDEAALLLKEMILELSRPEYKEAVSLLRQDLFNRYPDAIARPLNAFLYIAENGADASMIDGNFIQQELDSPEQSVCFEYPKVIATTTMGALSIVPLLLFSLLQFKVLMAGLLFYCFIAALIIASFEFVLWPLCLAGVSAWSIYYTLGHLLVPFLFI